jgi:APA family basic amino acid/polyamine antiporter
MGDGRVRIDRRRHDAEVALKRSIGSPALFVVVYVTLASGLYFSLGAVADHALGLTPAVYLAAALFFVITVMTYMEGASLHQERAGATVFARHAFNELVSFIAGWAILLDFVILVAIAAFAATNYLAAFWSPLGHGVIEVLLAAALIAVMAFLNVMGVTASRIRRMIPAALVDVAMQLLVIVLGLVLVFRLPRLIDPIDLGRAPAWSDVIFALTLAAAAASTGLDASSGLAGEVAVGRRGLRRLVGARTATALVLYVGISLVALTALPVSGGHTALGGRFTDAPMLGVVGAFRPGTWLAESLRYLVAASAVLMLGGAANYAMLGLSRLGYSLATNRQIPSALGRLHPTRATPFVILTIAAVLAIALVIPRNLDFLVGIYAFGLMLAFTIAHLAVCVSRYREPDRDRPYAIPGGIRLGRGVLPLPAVLGAVLSAAGWISVLILHDGARTVGLPWLGFGLALYLIYRLSEGKPLLKRVVIPAEALAKEPREVEYGSILVPLLGTPLDDDIVQTAGRLAADEASDDADGEGGAVIEALWIFEIPMALPLDAALPDARLQEARRALARAKSVGEEYEGVEVATATVRARRVGQAIVDEARRRGVEVIVLGAEEPSRVRGGALLGGRGGPLDNYLSAVTRYVIEKAPCRVILTAPPSDGTGSRAPADGAARAPAAPSESAQPSR